jgi:hypothetical protein
MSWKSIVITGLLCVVASPVLAQPGLVVDLVRTGGGLPQLDASGNWQWRVSVDPDETLFNTTDEGTGGSMAVEIGLTFTGASVLGATVNETNFDENNFGDSPFAFGENPDDGLTISGNQIFAALGSTFFTDGALKEVFTVTTQGPSTVGPNLTTGVEWLGAYSGNARVAQNGTNYDSFVGSVSKTVLGGDANLNGSVTAADYNILLLNFGQSGKHWDTADFNGNGTVTAADYNELLLKFGQSTTPPGSGSVSAAAVPEPASVAMLLMGSLLIVRRARRAA